MGGSFGFDELHAPRVRRGLVARPRLIERISRGLDCALTLVSAPAGFGKTTLLTEWLAMVSEPGGGSTAWLSLDQRDNDPASFWTYVIAALQTTTPGVAPMRSPSWMGRGRRSRWSWARWSTTSRDLELTWCWCWTITTSSTHARCRTGWPSCWSISRRSSTWRLPSRADPALRLGAVEEPGRTGRDPCRRPAFHACRGRWPTSRGDGPGADRQMWSRSRRAPRVGSLRSSWRRSRCRDETSRRRSSQVSPGTTDISSTIFSRRSCSARPNESVIFCCRPRSWIG